MKKIITVSALFFAISLAACSKEPAPAPATQSAVAPAAAPAENHVKPDKVVVEFAKAPAPPLSSYKKYSF